MSKAPSAVRASAPTARVLQLKTLGLQTMPPASCRSSSSGAWTPFTLLWTLRKVAAELRLDLPISEARGTSLHAIIAGPKGQLDVKEVPRALLTYR
jgi:hypothetical protein